MSIYNRPKKKVWQNLGENITNFGPLHGTEDPTFAPTAVGVVYVTTDPAALKIFISTGISSSNDWKAVWID
jgi:hypothetical protein